MKKKNKLERAVSKFNAVMRYHEVISTAFGKASRGFSKELLFLKDDLNLNFSITIDV